MSKAVRILIACLLLSNAAVANTDSLWTVWNNEARPDSLRLAAMQTLAWKAVFEKPDSGIALAGLQLRLALRANDGKARYMAYTTMAVGSAMKGDHPASIEFFQQCLVTARELGDRNREANTYSNLSNVYRNLGDLPMALEQLHRSLSIDQALDNKPGLAGTYNNIGNIQTDLGELDKALDSYAAAAALYQELDQPRGKAQTLMNLGVTRLGLGQRPQAVEDLLRSLDLFHMLGQRMEAGMAFNNLARAYQQLGRPTEAHRVIDSAHTIFTALGSKKQLARTHYLHGELLLSEGRPREALRVCQEGALMVEGTELLQQRRECRECLMHAHAALGDFRSAYLAQSEFITLDDSLRDLNNRKEVDRREMQRTFQEKQIADSLDNVRQRYDQEREYTAMISAQREQRNMLFFGALGVLLLAGGLYNRLRFVRRSRAAIQVERERSDRLLLNILPADVAEELKRKGSADARTFPAASVLFSDFKGFTTVAEQLSPEELVAEIDHCFRGMDDIVQHHGVEKIKTIGDAYMAVAGVPDPKASSAKELVMAALEMQEFIQRRYTERLMAGKPAFEMRIGLHTGPVVAGIVGSRKFQYDIWGDTVNTASRMESSGTQGEVNISEATYALVKDLPGLTFVPRGMVEAKGKGPMAMYFVRRGSARA